MLFVSAGESLSLQFHRVKDESWYVYAGRAKIELGDAGEAALKEEVVAAPAFFRFEPGTVHRVSALEDTTIIEVSTPQLDDVVRLEDLYGREGTIRSLDTLVLRFAAWRRSPSARRPAGPAGRRGCCATSSGLGSSSLAGAAPGTGSTDCAS